MYQVTRVLMKENAKKGADRAYYKLIKIKEKNSNPKVCQQKYSAVKIRIA